jgi:hypothetical protein
MVFREFTDQAGVAWEAWEAHPTLTERRLLRDRRAVVRDTPERRTMHVPRRSLARDPKGWITFRSRSERRRTPIPERWDELSDQGLRALLARARSNGPMRLALGYSPIRALTESIGLAATNVFEAFSASVTHYVETGTGEPDMIAAGRAVALEMRSRGMPPERFLRALRITGAVVARSAPTESLGLLIDARVTRAIKLFLLEYF